MLIVRDPKDVLVMPEHAHLLEGILQAVSGLGIRFTPVPGVKYRGPSQVSD